MQIYLVQNKVNDVVLTLREKSLLWSLSSITPYYLFQFTSPQTNKSLYFVSTNLSPLSAQSSYDEFNIICTGNTYINYSAGTINPNPGIHWEYTIYEQASRYNFSTSNTVSIVEQGKVFYSSTTQDFAYTTTATLDSHNTFTTFNTY